MSRTVSLEERQLKPIYEALDTGNVKSALTHCNKLLKKYPAPPAPGTPPNNSPMTVSRQLLTGLKILALVRANKLDEASTLTTALLAETPTDETVLTTLAHSLKPLDRPKELVGMWVNAAARAGKDVEEAKKKLAKGGKSAKGAITEADLEKLLQHSEELGAQAFMAMVRTGHWAMAQSTAFKLYRTFAPPKGQENAQAHQSLRYLYWSTMAAIMQSEYPSPPPPVPVLVMIPPPAQVREWEEAKKKEEEEDKKLLAEQAQANVNGTVSTSTTSPTRRRKRALALALAQRLVEMSVDMKDGNIVGEEAALRGMSVERFWLWGEVMRRVAQMAEDENIPERSDKWAKAHQLMSSPLASRAAGSSLHVEELRAEIAKKAEDWKRECEGMAARLAKGDRNWKTFTIFLDALFHFLPNAGDAPDVESYPCRLKPAPSEVAKQEATPTEGTEEKTEAPTAEDEQATTEKLPLTVENVRAFFKELADADEAIQAARERASHLAVLELERRLRKYPNLIGDAAPDYVGLLKGYFEKFGSKPVIVEDLLPYILEIEAGSEERGKWDEFLGGIEHQSGDDIVLQTTINVLKLQRLAASGPSCTIDSEVAFAKSCTKVYHAALPLGKDLVSTELQPADDLAVLAATALLTAYHLASQDASTDSQSYLLDTITLLEFASQKSRWAYPSRFLLVRLYRLVGAPALSLQHYGMANLKSIQYDTLAHHVLTRASTFSLSCVGDLGLVNECVESSQIYHVSGIETSDQLVKAFQYERYSQVAEFVLLDEKIENSFQRDLTKLEHFRMKNLHEGLTPESVEVELVELRFVWGRTHHDNRDLELLPNYQATGMPSIESLTSVAGGPVSKQWFNTMLKMWILVLHQASEQLWTEEEQARILPKISAFDEDSLQHLTLPEQQLVKYSRAILDWLAPHHTPIKHAVMVSAVTTLAAAKAKHAASNASSPATSTTPNPRATSGRKANGLSNGTEGTAASNVGDGAIGVKVGDMKIVTGMLTLHEPMDVPPPPKDLGEAVKEPPTELTDLLDEFQKTFDDTLAKPTVLPWEQLHIAQIIHEVAYITHLLTARFALGSGKKKSHPTFRPLRAKAISLLDHVAKAISKLGEEEITPDTRKQWLAARRSNGVLDELTDEHILSVGRNYLESKKRMFEQLGKGMTKAQQSIAKAAAGVPPGSS